MSDDTGKTGPTEPAEIEAEIARTREDLAETVDELTARLDVKQRAKDKVAAAKSDAADRLHAATHNVGEKVHHLQDGATDSRGRPKPAVSGAAAGLAAAAAAVVVLVVWRRRRARRRPWQR